MTCTCPKCHQKIELDLPEVSEAGTAAACPSCNARFTVFRESFGGRALRKASEISCAACGSELGAEMHCTSCGAQFPDYLVISLGRKRSRRETKKVKLKTSPFPKREGTTAQLPSLGMSMSPDGAAKAHPVAAAGSRYPKPVVLTVALLVVLALVAGGSMFYLKNKQEKSYAKNFVLATYCLQAGYDRSLKACARIATEWKAKTEAGQPYQARASMDDERELGIIGSKFESALGKLATPPEKFAACGENLNRLQAIYAKAHALILAPGTSMQGFTDAVAKLNGDYKLAAKGYSTGLPSEIKSELSSTSLKFKTLRPLIQ